MFIPLKLRSTTRAVFTFGELYSKSPFDLLLILTSEAGLKIFIKSF